MFGRLRSKRDSRGVSWGTKRKWIVAASVLLGGLGLSSLALAAVSPRTTDIKLTANGFEPNRVVIAKGSAVRWTNVDTNNHWPASNPHPVHTDYPINGGCIGSILDACHPLNKGESFTFTFDAVGTWQMHDHLNPAQGMTVIVTQTAAASVWTRLTDLFQKRTTMPAPANFKNLPYFTQVSLMNDYAKSRPKEAWDYLKQAYLVDGQAVGNAHQLAHIVGNQLYYKYGIKGASDCDAAFGYGCFHGVTEQAVKAGGDQAVSGIEQACTEEFTTAGSLKLTGCLHGIGHGVLSRAQYNLKDGLKACEVLKSQNQEYCYDGVFMEFTDGAPLEKLKSDSPICDSLNRNQFAACGKYLPDIASRIGVDRVAICSGSSQALVRSQCYSSIGFRLAEQYQSDVAQIIAGCQNSSSGRSDCITGAANEVIFQKYVNYQATSAQLCQSLAGSAIQECLDKNAKVSQNYQADSEVR